MLIIPSIINGQKALTSLEPFRAIAEADECANGHVHGGEPKHAAEFNENDILLP